MRRFLTVLPLVLVAAMVLIALEIEVALTGRPLWLTKLPLVVLLALPWLIRRSPVQGEGAAEEEAP